MTEPVIVVEDLRKKFGDVHALDGVSFEVPAGTVFGLLGPNGAGKTTAVRILSTVLRPDGGRATVLGHDVSAEADEVRRSIGLAGQNAAVDANLTGRENLRMVGLLRQLPRGEVISQGEDLLERFELTDAADRPLRTYSGGMRRRLDIAASLLGHPSVLFLDEPTTGLDVTSRNQLWDTIRSLVAGGTTVLLTTQYLEEADRLAGRIAVIDRGKVLANDTPKRLKADLGGTVIELGFEEEAGRAAAIIERSVGAPTETTDSIVKITSDRGAHMLVEILKTLADENMEPASLSVHEPSLDDVFLSLTGHHAESETQAPPRKARGAR